MGRSCCCLRTFVRFDRLATWTLAKPTLATSLFRSACLLWATMSSVKPPAPALASSLFEMHRASSSAKGTADDCGHGRRILGRERAKRPQPGGDGGRHPDAGQHDRLPQPSRGAHSPCPLPSAHPPPHARRSHQTLKLTIKHLPTSSRSPERPNGSAVTRACGPTQRPALEAAAAPAAAATLWRSTRAECSRRCRRRRRPPSRRSRRRASERSRACSRRARSS